MHGFFYFLLFCGAFCALYGVVQLLWRDKPPLLIQASLRERKIGFVYAEERPNHRARQTREGWAAVGAGLFLLLFLLMFYLEASAR